MNNFNMEAVETEEQIRQVSDLAVPIWHEHFTPIIGEDQVIYMIDKFQSFDALKKQVEDGYEYFLIQYNGEYVGYSGIKISDGALFLSKLYLLKEYRGLKLGSAAMHFYEDMCKTPSLEKIWLTCNKDNEKSIEAYKKMGFRVTRTQVADIGNGFVMDDYILEKSYQ